LREQRIQLLGQEDSLRDPIGYPLSLW